MKQLQVFPAYRVGDDTFTSIQPAGLPVLDHKPVRGRKKALAEFYDARARTVENGTFARPTQYSLCDAVLRPTDPEIEALYPMTAGTKEIDVTTLAERVVARLGDYIAANWDYDAKHLIMCSSGYDSRLLMALLPDHLDNTWICCFQPEIELTCVILEYLELDHLFLPIAEHAEPTDYYAECLDFETIGANFSESQRFWGGALLMQLRLGDWLDDSVQGVSALFSDETQKWNRLKEGTIGRWLGVYLFDNPSIMPGKGGIEFMLPFISLERLKLLTEYHVPVRSDEFKRAMLNVIDPKLAEFENWRHRAKAVRKEAGGHIYQQRISDATRAKMLKDYKASWYYGQTQAEIGFGEAFAYTSAEGSHYIKAAIFEHHRRAK